jgi:hypothetical protein
VCGDQPVRREAAEDPGEAAARLAEAQKVQAAIRAHRNRLGITPSGKVLPRRVTVG